MKLIKYIALGLLLNLSGYVFAQSKGSVIGEKIRLAKEQGKEFKHIVGALTVKNNYENAKVSKDLKSVVYYDYDVTKVEELFSNSTGYISLQIPDAEQQGAVWDLDLFEVAPSVYDNDISINGEMYTESLGNRKHYRGVVRGKETESVVAISLFKNEITGMISINGMPTFNVRKIKGDDTHIIYKESNVSNLFAPAMLLKGGINNKSASGNCVHIELVTEKDIVGDLGSYSATVNYLEARFNELAAFYQTQYIELRLQHKDILYGSDDTYTSFTTAGLLNEYKSGKSSINGDLSVLLTFRDLSWGQLNKVAGAAASVNGLCQSDVDNSLAVAGILKNSHSHTVAIIANELGHLLGSSNSYVNYTLGSGPQPGIAIRNYVANAPCISSCCVSNRNIVTDFISSLNIDFEASNNITANNTIFSGATIDYDAGNKVILTTGFRANSGSNFRAFIDGCGGARREANIDETVLVKESYLEPLFVDELGVQIGMKVYPNPNTGQFNIELNSNEEKASVVVYDLMGKIVYSQNSVENIQKIDISEQPKGIYMIKIQVGEKVFNEKVIYQ